MQEAAALGIVEETTVSPTYECPSATFLMIALWHVLFFYHWNKRRKRKHLSINYRTIVQKKQFYKIWIALLSHPSQALVEGGTTTSEATTPLPLSDWLIDLGHAEHQASDLPSWERRLLCRAAIFKCLGGVSKHVWWLLSRGDLSGLPLLVYNSHILWSCRALEVALQGASWNYARILLCWGLLSFTAELYLSHVLLQRILTLMGFTSRQPQYDSDVMQRLNQKLLKRPMGSSTTIAATVLLVFYLKYPYVPLQILPFIGNGSLLNEVPAVCYFLSVGILTILSRHSHPILGVVFGGMVGLFWSVGWIDFLADPYWNSCFLLGWGLFSALSFRARHWLPCIEHVSWNERGQLLVRDEHTGRWIPDPQQYGDDDGNDHMSDNSSSRDSSARAFPASDDEEIYGSRLQEDDDLEANIESEMVPRTSASAAQQSSTRSRRLFQDHHQRS